MASVNSGNRKWYTKPMYLFGILIVIVIFVVVGYFSVWRPTDDEYKAASEQLTIMNNSSKTLALEVLNIKQPSQIDDAALLRMQILVNIYKTSAEKLEKSPVVGRDTVVRPVHAEHEEVLGKFLDTANQLHGSMKTFVAVLKECSSLIGRFASVAISEEAGIESCEKSLKDASASKHNAFNNAFFTEFLEQTTSYVGVLKSGGDLSDSDKQRAKDALEAIQNLRTTELKLQLSDISDSLNDLKSVVDKQKSAFWR